MKILVTGGRGYVGQALVGELRRRGHDVFSLDLLHHFDPRHLRADLRSYRALEAAMAPHDFELVYHLAAEAGRWNGEDHYESLWTTNVVGTKNLIRLQERHRFRLVFMSSSEVYGDWDGVMHEDVMDREPIRQLNDYAMSKWVGEQQVCNSARMSGTESVRIRMFNLYGPGEYFGANRGVIARFIYQALHGLPYTVYLHHHRTSTYIDDGVAGLAAVASHFVPGAVYNLGGHEYHDIRQLSDLILNKLGMDDRLVSYVSDEQFTTRDKQVSFERARLELGYEPRIGLDEGLERTIAWARRAYAEAS